MDKKHIKEHLLTAEYGRFDHLPDILPKDVLAFTPPRIVVSHLVAELGIEKNDIPMPALRSWLFNYRKKKGKNKTAVLPVPSVDPDKPEITNGSGRMFSGNKNATETPFDF